MLASGQRPGRMWAEGQVGPVCMPTGTAVAQQQCSSEPDTLTAKSCSKLPFRAGCESKHSKSRSKPWTRQTADTRTTAAGAGSCQPFPSKPSHFQLSIWTKLHFLKLGGGELACKPAVFGCKQLC